MAQPQRHIERLLRECYRIEQHGHCHDGAEFVAIKDVETAIDKLKDAFGYEQSMKNERRKHGRKTRDKSGRRSGD